MIIENHLTCLHTYHLYVQIYHGIPRKLWVPKIFSMIIILFFCDCLILCVFSIFLPLGGK